VGAFPRVNLGNLGKVPTDFSQQKSTSHFGEMKSTLSAGWIFWDFCHVTYRLLLTCESQPVKLTQVRKQKRGGKVLDTPHHPYHRHPVSEGDVTPTSYHISVPATRPIPRRERYPVDLDPYCRELRNWVIGLCGRAYRVRVRSGCVFVGAPGSPLIKYRTHATKTTPAGTLTVVSGLAPHVDEIRARCEALTARWNTLDVRA
jgi:hypothetical protein